MKITVKALKRRAVERLEIESVDLSLYIAHAEVDGQRMLIMDASGKTLKTRNLLDMKEALASIKAAATVLVQRSAYDEMVGRGAPMQDNTLEVPLGAGYESLPPWQH